MVTPVVRTAAAGCAARWTGGSGGEEPYRPGGVGFGGDVEQWCGGGGQGVRSFGAGAVGGFGAPFRDPFEVVGEAGEDGGGVEGVQAEQADRGGGRAADVLVADGVGGVQRGQAGGPGGQPEDD